MATNCFATESASYRAAYDIEQRIDQLLAEGKSFQEAELKGVEERNQPYAFCRNDSKKSFKGRN